MKYYVFILNRFNQVACVGEAEDFPDGQIALDLDVTLPEKTKIILTPQQQKLAPVVELKVVR